MASMLFVETLKLYILCKSLAERMKSSSNSCHTSGIKRQLFKPRSNIASSSLLIPILLAGLRPDNAILSPRFPKLNKYNVLPKNTNSSFDLTEIEIWE